MRIDDVGEHARAIFDYGGGGFVTGSLDAEQAHSVSWLPLGLFFHLRGLEFKQDLDASADDYFAAPIAGGDFEPLAIQNESELAWRRALLMGGKFVVAAR